MVLISRKICGALCVIFFSSTKRWTNWEHLEELRYWKASVFTPQFNCSLEYMEMKWIKFPRQPLTSNFANFPLETQMYFANLFFSNIYNIYSIYLNFTWIYMNTKFSGTKNLVLVLMVLFIIKFGWTNDSFSYLNWMVLNTLVLFYWHVCKNLTN